MAESNELLIKVNGDVSGADKALQEAAKGIQGVGQATSDVNKKVSVFGETFKGVFAANIVTAGLSAIKSGFSSFVGVVGDAVSKAREGEQVNTRLDLSLQYLGKEASTVSEQIKKFADQVQQTTAIGDDNVKSIAVILAQYGRLSSDVLPSATVAVLEFASATGKSQEEAAQIFTNAINGQTRGLAKLGINFEATGNKAKDAAALADIFQQRFAGASAALSNTFGGSVKQAENNLSELSKSFGFAITQTPALTGLIKGLNSVFIELNTFINENKSSVQGLVKDGINILVSAFSASIDVLRVFSGLFTGLQVVFESVKIAIAGVGTIVFKLTESFLAATNAVQSFFGVSNQFTQNAQQNFKDLGDSAIDYAAKSQQAIEQDIENAKTRDQLLSDFKDKSTNTLNQSIAEREAAANAEFKIAQDTNNAIDEEQSKKEQERLQRISEFKAEENRIIQERNAELAVIQAESENAGIANSEAVRQAQLQAALAKNDAELQSTLQKNQAIKSADERAAADSLAREKKASADKVLISKSEADQKVKIREAENLITNNLLQGGLLLAKQGSMEQKALNAAQAIRNTYQGATLALATYPPPFNAIAAASTIALGLAQVSKITAANNGALVTDGQRGVDSVPFLLSRGEIVAPARSFDEVVEGTARQRGFVPADENNSTQSSETSINISIQGDFIGDEIYINKLANALRDAVQFRDARLA
jgi:hypothetical protein